MGAVLDVTTGGKRFHICVSCMVYQSFMTVLFFPMCKISFFPPTLYFLRTSNKIIQGKLMNDVEPMETWHQRHQYNFHFRAMKFTLMSKYLRVKHLYD